MSQLQGSNRLEFPDLEAEFGGEAVQDAASTLRRENHGLETRSMNPTIEARIRGIDFLDRVRVFAAVENRMRGREHILEALQKRAEYLRAIGDREERMEYVKRRSEDGDESSPAEPDPTYQHEVCGTVVKQESSMAWYCPACDQRTNRVEQVDSTSVEYQESGAVFADGGGQE